MKAEDRGNEVVVEAVDDSYKELVACYFGNCRTRSYNWEKNFVAYHYVQYCKQRQKDKRMSPEPGSFVKVRRAYWLYWIV